MLFLPHCTACGIFIPRTGIEPVPLPLEAQILSHWTTKEVPDRVLFILAYLCVCGQ